MNAMYKGSGPEHADYAKGGECLNKSRSRFMKTPDMFRTDIQRTNYDKKSPGGEMSKTVEKKV